MRALFLSIAAIGMIASGPAMAQAEPSYPPLAKDYPPGYELSSGSLPAVLGISPGMTMAEAEAIIVPLAVPESLEYREEIQAASDPNTGEQFGFLYRTALAADLVPAVEGSSDRLTVYYTTALTNSRVKRIDRTVTYTSTPFDKLPGFERTLDAIVSAYGEPSLRKQAGTGVYLYWLYWDGALVTTGFEDKMLRCEGTPGMTFYNFVANRIDDYAHCTALVEVSANPHYDATNSLLTLDIEISDYRRAFDDAVLTDQYILDGLAADQGGGDGPDVKL